MTQVLRHCTICSEERIFEQPPCVDDHDPDCPEWICVDCGAALFFPAVGGRTAASVA